MDSRSPNFFILGAAKAGTTTLHRYLTHHPRIFLSDIKEPQFFCNEKLYAKGFDFYLDTFFRGSDAYPVRGEATPHYIYYRKVAQRLASELSRENLRFVVILRDPVARAYSLYWNMVAEGLEKLSFEEALLIEGQRLADSTLEYAGSVSFHYVDSGMYAKQINAYLEYFSREQFHFVLFEEFQEEPFRALNRICKFLGVEEFQALPQVGIRNSSALPRFVKLHQFLRGEGAIKNAMGKIIPTRFKYRIVSSLLELNRKPHRYPSMPMPIQQSLRHRFSADVEELESIIGKSLQCWLPGHK